jgi:large subunit ribosomal protein L9
MPSTDTSFNSTLVLKANEAKIAKENLEAAKELGAKIEKVSVSVPIKVGENGRAFGAVTAKEISDALDKQCGIKVDKKKIQLKEAIKAVSEADVPVKLHPEVTALLKVKVVAE